MFGYAKIKVLQFSWLNWDIKVKVPSSRCMYCTDLTEWLRRQMRRKEVKMKKAGIIGAMEIEVARLKEMMTEVTVTEKASVQESAR